MTTYNMDLIDKSEFICLKFKDNSVYYGEIAYMDQDGNIFYSLDDVTDDNQRRQLKKVRHGNGIQIFNACSTQANEGQKFAKYEGQWYKDQQDGQAKIVYPDGSIYEGEMREGVISGYGKYVWNSGKKYEGNWVNGRLDGGGKMTSEDGHELKGIFRNNYFHKDNQTYLNPFMATEEINIFLKNQKHINAIKERNYNKKLFQFNKCFNFRQTNELIQKSQQNNRLTLLLSSKQLQLKKNELFNNLEKTRNLQVSELDMRKVYTQKTNLGNFDEYQDKIKRDLANVFIKGGTFVINVDDSDTNYDEIYDPDISDFYSPAHFPIEIWNLNQLTKPEVYEKILQNTSQKFQTKLSKNIQIIVWSKYRLDQNESEQKILEKFERRFYGIIPLQKIDLILLCEEEKQVLENNS